MSSGYLIDRRIHFLHAKKTYKKTISQIQLFAKERKIHRLADIEKRDPKTFWREIKAIISPNSQGGSSIEAEEWNHHFGTLLSGSNTPANKLFSDYVDISLPGLEEIAPDNDNLNKRPMGLDALLENQLGHLPKFQKLHIYPLSNPRGRN